MVTQLEVVNPASPRHAEQMRALAIFAGAHKIEYKDLGLGEDYILTKTQNGQIETLELRVRGNRDQGGFLSLDVQKEAASNAC